MQMYTIVLYFYDLYQDSFMIYFLLSLKDSNSKT